MSQTQQRSNKATRDAPAKLVIRRSLQPGVFRLGLLEDRDAGVGVFPEREEILVGSLCLVLISRQSERSAELQVRQCADGIADHDPPVSENFLEFPGGFDALVCGQIGLATHIDRIEGPGSSSIAFAGSLLFSARSARIAGR